jgi:heat shock protein HtpX
MRNNVKTAVLLTALCALLLGIGSLFGSAGLWIGFGLAVVMVGGSYWFSDKIAVRAAGAVPVSEADAPQLYAIVRDLTQRAGLPMPSIYLSPAAQPNAFATGRNPEHAAVAVTQGLMQIVDQEELRGVLAHELSHVRNRDILITSVAATIALGITLLARMLMWGAIFGGIGGGGRDRNGNFLGAIAMMILAPIAAGLLQLALSRSREFEADHSGAKLLGDGEPLARALEKIDAYSKQIPMNIDPALATAYIVNPLTGKQANFANLFRSHPPTEERIARLRHQARR